MRKARQRLSIAGIAAVLAAGAAQAAPAPRLSMSLALDSTAMLTAARVQDDPLAGFIAEALANNAALGAQNASVQARFQALREARAQRLPQLDLKARYSVADGGRTIDFPAGDLLNPVYATLNQLTGTQQFPQIQNQSIDLLREKEQDTRLTLVAPLFAPQLDNAIDARESLYQAETASREALARTLVRDVKQASYALAQARAGIVILESSERTLGENVRVAQALQDAGKATRDRRLRAEAERLAVVQRLDAARAQSQQAQRYLNFLRGQPLDTAVELPPAEGPVAEAVEAGRSRPELRQIEHAVDAADARRRAARAGRWPTLALAGDYGVEGERYEFDREHDFSMASLVLNWSVFDFGLRRAQQAQAAAETASLRAQRDDLRQKLVLAEQAAREDLAVSLRAIDSANARREAADESFRISSRKRDEGQLSQVEFFDAERTLTDARLNQVIARQAALSRAAELEYTTAAYPLPAQHLAE
ncbi:TolC family protein [Solimonas sp. K1W22B-7]|uniref:TolC family protein n=1 Tax=Solimonas sp. K1W22B-7 TaxID=2303331 RepID=UPI000E3358B9|nr:TolC family protein [Solimonas sp. K1W22B-7]AXQ31001.1 TolC family protein [Solimonas sp. K1W22B-7]